MFDHVLRALDNVKGEEASCIKLCKVNHPCGALVRAAMNGAVPKNCPWAIRLTIRNFSRWLSSAYFALNRTVNNLVDAYSMRFLGREGRLLMGTY